MNEIQFLTVFYKFASILPRPQNIPPWPLSRAWVRSSELRDWTGHQARQRSADPVLLGVQSLDLERFHVEPSHWAACGADLNLFQKDNRRLFRSTGWVPQFGATCPGLIAGGINAHASVVQKLHNAVHLINLYPVDNAIAFANAYPLDSAIQRLNNWGLLVFKKLRRMCCLSWFTSLPVLSVGYKHRRYYLTALLWSDCRGTTRNLTIPDSERFQWLFTVAGMDR